MAATYSGSETVLHSVEGNVKFFGMDHGTQSWKTGGLSICQSANGQHVCKMYFAAGAPKTFLLTNKIKSVTSVTSNPNRCIIQLKTGCNITLDKGRQDQVAALVTLVKSLMGKSHKTPNGLLNGFQKSPGRALGNSQGKSITTPSRQSQASPRSQLFSHVGGSEYQKSISVKDFEKEPITKLPFFLEEDDDQYDKENLEVSRSTLGNLKKTPLQMRMDGRGSIFKESKEEKLNTLKEKKSKEFNSNYIASSFYGSRGQSNSNYASVDRFKDRSYQSNSVKSPSSRQFMSAPKKLTGSRQQVFSFKPKSSAKFVPKSGLFPSKTLQGFSNLGNTCYMNAILQSLYGLKSFREELIHSDGSRNLPGDSLTHAIRVLFVAKDQNKPREVIRKLLLRVKNAISKSATRFSGSLQHDAQEFLCQCMDQLKEDTEKMNKAITEIGANTSLEEIKFSPPTTDNVEFAVLHTIRCLECGETVTKEEVFHDLSLDMPKRSKFHPSTIQVALDQFFESEDIDYACEKCEGKDARLSHNFTRLSRYIILNLKRYVFDYDSSQNAKLQEKIHIPKYLTLSRHCIETVQKPGDHQETPTELPMRGSSSPRRRLSFDTRGDREGNCSSPKRQKLDFSAHDSSMEQLPDVKNEKTQQQNGSGDHLCPSKDFATMTEEEQIEYVIQLSKSETPNKVDFFPIKSSISQKQDKKTSIREETTSSVLERDERRKPLEHDSNCQDGLNVEHGNFVEKKADNTDQNTVKERKENEENFQAMETFEKAEDATVPVVKSEKSEKDIVFQVESDKDTQESEDNSGGQFKKKDSVKISERKLSNEEREAKEEEELRKAKELSLQEQNEVTLREEEELRKAQELSLQEFQKSSPPLISMQVEEESPEKPLYSREEWLELAKNAEEGDMPNSYRLISVVSHMGSSLTTGHYVSDVYDSKSKSWLSCDDSNVTVISESRVREDRRRTGYIFFYERV